MTHKILIIDDEESVLLIVKQAFAGHCEVLTAQGGEAGLEIIKKEKPSFVFLDIAMPGMSGISVLESIKELGSVPVVWMLTGSEDLDTAAFTLKGGASGYLTKPFDIDRLRSVVFNALLDLEKNKQEFLAEDKPWHVKKINK
ncbi:MAG: response regulator [Elusimicrobiota bacterium]|nr:response regulator [Elusimicrobiota bacterium]